MRLELRLVDDTGNSEHEARFPWQQPPVQGRAAVVRVPPDQARHLRAESVHDVGLLLQVHKQLTPAMELELLRLSS